MEALPLRAGRANCMSNIQQDMIEQTLAILASMMQQAAHDATLYCAEAKRTVIMPRDIELHTQERSPRRSRLPRPPLLAGSFPSKYVPSATHTATSVTCRRYRPSPQSPGAQSALRCDPEQAKKVKNEEAGRGNSHPRTRQNGQVSHTWSKTEARS
eukprot:SAG25_NODE_2546_length_1539_cov_19.854167_2_plen_156_part_00